MKIAKQKIKIKAVPQHSEEPVCTLGLHLHLYNTRNISVRAEKSASQSSNNSLLCETHNTSISDHIRPLITWLSFRVSQLGN